MSETFPPPLPQCALCGSGLPMESTNGLCPACLMAEIMKPSAPKKAWVPPSAEELAELLPQYEITRMLGRGGMGAVYQGRQKSLDRAVAIKILSQDLDEADATFHHRFKNEARAMARLSHPGIVAVYDFGETADGMLYIVMEFVEGTDVARMIAQSKRLHTEQAMAVTAHVCDALTYAHERGIIHRDIKPANIMVGYDGVVKIADFGLAKMSQDHRSGLTQSGMALGTLHYMAPETLTLGVDVDQRADIYAVGVMLYQMLTGKIPHGIFELPSLQVPGLDPRYDGIIGKALREDRDLRYPNTQGMRSDLDAILTAPVLKVHAGAAHPPPALDTQARPQRPAGQPYRPPQSPVAAGSETAKSGASPLLWVAFIALCGLAGWAWFQKGQEKQTAVTVAPAGEMVPPSKSALPSAATAPTGNGSSSSSGTAPLVRSSAPAAGVDTVAPPLPPGTWQNLLAEDLSKTFSFSTGKPSDLIRQPDGSSVKSTSVVTLISRTTFKDCAIRLRFGGQFENFPWLIVRSTGGYEYVGCFLRNNSVRWTGHHQTPAKFESTLLASAQLDTNLLNELPLDLEIRVVGDSFTLLRDGKVVLAAQNSTHPLGSIGLRLENGAILERFEVMPLEPAAFSDTAKVSPQTSIASAAVDPTPPLPPGTWQNLLTASPAEALNFSFRNPSDLVRQPDGVSYKANAMVTVMSKATFKDCAIRIKFGGSFTSFPWLITRSTAGKNYVGCFMRNSAVQWNSYYPTASKDEATMLSSTQLDTNLLNELPLEFELRIVGDTFTLLRDGKVVLAAQDSQHPSGTVGITLQQGVLLERFEVMPLESKKPALAPQFVASITPPSAATKDQPFVNTLGMRFVPVPGTKVLMCIHETRRADYAVFAKETPALNDLWSNLRFHQFTITDRVEEHPAAHMSWEDAKAFCDWLSQKEGVTYRLPTKKEWAAAAGPGIYAWGNEWPPPPGAGNFSDRSRKEKAQNFSSSSYFEDLDDGFPTTAPVMSFQPNALGIYDLAGNLDEWCADVSRSGAGHLVAGGSWMTDSPGVIRTENQASYAFGDVPVGTGFRCVIDLGSKAPQANATATAPPPESPAAAPLPVGPTKWTDTKGRDLQATFKSLASGSVTLDIAGRAQSIPLETLSLESQSLARNYQQQAGKAAMLTLAKASKDAPFINSLGMKFIAVPSSKVLMSIYETRVQDFRAFVTATKFDYKKGSPTYYGGRENTSLDWEVQTPTIKGPVPEDNPVLNISWEDAQAFNQWLTEYEQSRGMLPPGCSYRLPTLSEWNSANGPGLYAWGSEWPPPPMAGNFSNTVPNPMLENFAPAPASDAFTFASPVGSFAPNALGFYDLDGNAGELGQEITEQNGVNKVNRRGSSFSSWRDPRSLSKSTRTSGSTSYRNIGTGFRSVLEIKSE